MRLIRRIIWSAFLLLWVGAAALWVRSYWRTDDVFLLYGGQTLEHLRIRRGIVSVTHKPPQALHQRLSIGRVKVVVNNGYSEPGEVEFPLAYAIHRQRLGVSFDSLSSARITSFQVAHAAKIGIANQKAWAASQASYKAYERFQDAMSWADRGAKFTERENVSIAYWQMQAAREHAVAMRAAQVQIAAAGVPSLTPQWQVMFPGWYLLAVAAIAVAIPLWKAMARRRRIGRGLCGHCGYDLHANTSGVCPECGNGVAIALCRSVTVDGKRMLSIAPSASLTAIGSR